MNQPQLFHHGETKVQRQAGEFDTAQVNGRVISNMIPGGAVPFLSQLQLIWISSVDYQGTLCCTPLFGYPGFITAPTPDTLVIDKTKLLIIPEDPFWQNIQEQVALGILALEQSTRRRLRVNGFVNKKNKSIILINVIEAYPNCPKYITRRGLHIKLEEDIAQKTNHSQLIASNKQLSSKQQQLIEQSDSFFVASAFQTIENGQKDFRCDASHRGGYPGFVEVKKNRLIIPDYKGNSMFNTLGNIEQYNHASILFIDYQNNRYLQLSGKAKILWDQDDPQSKSAGTKRFWQLDINRCYEYQLSELIEWSFLDYSPHNPRPKQQLETQQLDLVIDSVEIKSERIKLFRLIARSKGVLPAFEPGAHLPIELTASDGRKLVRHYSILSSSRDNRFYEIAVQKELNGRGGSKYIHDTLTLDSAVSASAPVNNFSMQPSDKHHILIAGGIGVTPILSMARELSESNKSFEVHYAASDKTGLVFKQELKKLANGNSHFYYSKGKGAKRLDIEALLQTHPPETQVFICGPNRMLQAVRETAEKNGWKPAQIHFESFGVASSKDDKSFKVRLTQSDKVITVEAQQTLLEALEASSIQVPNDCRRGECGMCVTNIVKGEVEHRDVYLSKEEQKTQMCVCVSRAKGNELVLSLP